LCFNLFSVIDKVEKPKPRRTHKIMKSAKTIAPVSSDFTISTHEGEIEDPQSKKSTSDLDARDFTGMVHWSTLSCILERCRPVRAKVNDGCVYVGGKLGDTSVRVRAVVGSALDSAYERGLAAYAKTAVSIGKIADPTMERGCEALGVILARVDAVLGPCYVQIKHGVVHIQTVIGKSTVDISTPVCAGIARVREIFQPVETCVRNGYVYVTVKTDDKVVLVKTCLSEIYDRVSVKALTISEAPRAKAAAAVCFTSSNAAVITSSAKQVAADERFQATAKSAAGGAFALGATGGGAGLLAGGTVGVAIGILPAIFTFGLSIPICGVVGSGAGLCIGTAAGSTVGFLGGGAAGYGLKSHGVDIASKVSDCAKHVQEVAASSGSYARARLARGTVSTS
jgi:hypothetical protein